MFSVCVFHALSVLCALADPRVCCDAPEHDFGTLDAGSVARHAFEVSNCGDGRLKLSVAVACCGAKAALARSELGPGETTSATVEVALRHFSNTVDKVVFLGTGDKKTPYLRLRLKGRVAASSPAPGRLSPSDVQPPSPK